MPIELAKIQLNRVHHIDTLERAALVHHTVPGLEGSLTQNLGRDSVRLRIEGIFYGAKASQDLETLRKAYKQRDPVDFLTDIVGQAYFSQVVLEQFEVAQSAQLPEQFSYRLTIAEYVPPKKSAAANQAAVKQAIKMQAKALMDIATLPDAISMGSIPELTNPAAPLNGAVDQVASALGGIGAPMEGLKALSGVTPEASTAPPTALPQPAPLAWGQPPPIEDLLAAGLPVKNLLSSGSSVETLVKAGASVLDLRQAGASVEQLAHAGVTAAALEAAEQTLKVVSVLETIPQITLEFLDEEGLPLAAQAYRLTKSNQTVVTGQLDAQGQCQLDIVTGDSFTISLPDLDREDWEYVVPPTLPTPDQQPVDTAEIAFQLIDVSGQPYANQAYQIILPDGRTQTGQLDAQGEARIAGIAMGTCSLSFPDLGAEDWQLVVPDAATTPPAGSPTPEPLPEPLPETPTETPSETLRGTDQITFVLVDAAGFPIAHQEYQITLPDGSERVGQLDDQGQARIEGIVAGDCVVTFPNLDAGDWQLGEVAPVVTPIVPQPDSDWLAFEVKTEDGLPLSGIRYELWQAGTIVSQGLSDQRGLVNILNLAAGNYAIVFPDLDAEDWQMVSNLNINAIDQIPP